MFVRQKRHPWQEKKSSEAFESTLFEREDCACATYGFQVWPSCMANSTCGMESPTIEMVDEGSVLSWKEKCSFFSRIITALFCELNLHGVSRDKTRLGFRRAIRIGYRLRWRSDTWRTDRGGAVRSPGIRPAMPPTKCTLTIRNGSPALRTKVRRKLLTKTSLHSLQAMRHQERKPKSARLAASVFFPTFQNVLGGHVQWNRRREL